MRIRPVLFAASLLGLLAAGPVRAASPANDLGDHVAVRDGRYSCFGEKATVVGTSRRDTILLTPGRDVVVTLGGADVVYNPDDHSETNGPPPEDPPANNDLVCTGPGHDYVRGAAQVDGGADRDEINGAQIVYGGPGDDHIAEWGCAPSEIHAGPGDDSVNAFRSYDGIDRCPGRGNDLIDGDAGADNLRGGDGNDRLYGGPGDDEIQGGYGDDILQGWAGNDALYGEAGDDILDGGGEELEIDTCDGGPGGDRNFNCEHLHPIG